MATSDSYEGITAGTASALTLLTGQSVTGYGLSPDDFGENARFDHVGDGLELECRGRAPDGDAWNSSGNLVGDHMYMITGVNAATDTFTIQNPWNTAYSGSLAMSFTETIQQLAQDDCALYATNGRLVA